MTEYVNKQEAIDAIMGQPPEPHYPSWYAEVIEEMPTAQPDMAENLYPYKCYITDKDGLQHEVIHTGDIRRVTGWEI